MKRSLSLLFTALFAFAHSGHAAAAITASGYNAQVRDAQADLLPPSIATGLTNQRVIVSNKVTFAVTATGASPLSYHWSKDGKALTNSAKITGVTNATLTLKSAALTDSGTYLVVITNAVGSNSSSATLVVYETKLPVLKITSPASATVVSNSDLITVKGTASDNVAVQGVYGTLVSSKATNALTVLTNKANWTSWYVTNVTLEPGSNVFSFYAQDTSSNYSTTNRVIVTYLPLWPLSVTNNGSGRTSRTNGQKLFLGSNYTIVATPAAGYVFTNWNVANLLITNTLSSSNITFTQTSNTTLTANFVPSPFPALAGAYTGLFYDTINGAATNSAGLFSANIKSNGTYTASIKQNGKTYSYSGPLTLAQTVSTNPAKSLALILAAITTNDGGTITGTVATNGGWSSSLTAYRNSFTAKSPTANVGKYTVAIAGTNNDYPAGYSSLAFTVAADGTVTASGKTADSATFTASSAISKGGDWPLYATLSGGGVLFGWQSVTNSALEGSASWVKPTNTTLHLPAFVYSTTNETGSVYTNKAPYLGITNATLVLSGGSLGSGSSLTYSVKFNGASLVDLSNTNAAKTNKLKFSLTVTNGLFSGSVVDPATKKTNAFNGVLLQHQTNGLGAFGSGTNLGTVVIKQPAQ